MQLTKKKTITHKPLVFANHSNKTYISAQVSSIYSNFLAINFEDENDNFYI